MLKSSVLQFRDDVHKQAKRIMQSHHESSMRASSSLIAGGGPSIMYGSRHSPLAAGNGNGNHDLGMLYKTPVKRDAGLTENDA